MIPKQRKNLTVFEKLYKILSPKLKTNIILNLNWKTSVNQNIKVLEIFKTLTQKPKTFLIINIVKPSTKILIHLLSNHLTEKSD